MKKLSEITIFLIVLLSPAMSLACKEAMLGKEYPLSEFTDYDHIVIVKIDKSIHSEQYRYKPLVSFEATVIESIKGNLGEGESFYGIPKHEQPRAVCPVHLTESHTYLLLLTKENEKYIISRFSFPVNSENKFFSNYIRQIKDVVRSG